MEFWLRVEGQGSMPNMATWVESRLEMCEMPVGCYYVVSKELHVA